MRRALDTLYNTAGYLAALCMVGTLIFVLLGITGRIFNFHLRGTDAYAGYCMAGAGFLALAHTLKRGEHIRVTLLLQAVGGPAHKALELWSLGAATLLAAALAWFSTRLAWQSWGFNDISTSTDATPLWIPQLAMAAGTIILLIAFIDEFVLEVRDLRRAPAQNDEPLHFE